MRRAAGFILPGFRKALRVLMLATSLLLLPPVCLALIVPLLLFGVPVAAIGIPFMLPALLTGTLSARSEARRRGLRARLARGGKVAAGVLELGR